MKKTNNKSVQSSVPVQHSHSTDSAEIPRSALPVPRSDTRLPIDHDKRAENRKLDTATLRANRSSKSELNWG